VRSLAGTSFVLLCFVLVQLVAPAGAQESGGISPGTDGDYSVVTSTGITCGGGGTTAADDQYGPGPVDNPKGVLPDTVVVRKVPETGGPPYIALAAVALLSVALIAGRAILRP
jgi:hypothetical protein